MTIERYGVIALFYEFMLSGIIFVGGGILMWHDPALMTQVFILWSVIMTFWFTRRTQETTQTNQTQAIQQAIQQALQQAQPPIPQPVKAEDSSKTGA